MPEGGQSHASAERYLRLLVLLSPPFALTLAVAAVAFRSVRVGLISLGVLALTLVSAQGLREVRRGQGRRALHRAGWGLLGVAVLGAVGLPQHAAACILLPVLAVTATLVVLEGRPLRRFVSATVGAEVLVGLALTLLPPAAEVPGGFVRPYVLVGIACQASVLLLLLYQSRLELRGRLEETARSEARFRSLVEASGAVVWSADARGEVRPSAPWQAFTGQAPQESVGLGWVEVLHPLDRAPALHAWREAVLQQRPFSRDCRIRRAQGGYAWFHVRAAPVFGADGRVVEWMGASVDVTQARLAEQRQRLLAEVSASLVGTLELDELLQRIAHAVAPRLADVCVVRLFEKEGPRPVVVAHEDPEVELRFQTLLARSEVAPLLLFGGMDGGKGSSAHLVELGPAEHAALARANPELARQFGALAPRSMLSAPLRSRRGELLGALTLVTVGPDARRLSGEDAETVEEIARRCALALENALLYRQAQDAVRTREDFLAVASHELRTPLAALTLSVEGLTRRLEAAQGPPDAGWVHERVRRLRRHARRLERLMEALLDVARIAGGRLRLELEEVELGALVHESVRRLEEEHGPAARVTERVRVHAPAPVVGRWDRLRVEQAVENLVGNALKYGERGPVEVTVSQHGAHAQLEVVDHGLGIPVEKQATIWAKFERHVSGRHYGGLGLGLYIVREVVDALGGEVTVRSEPGEGSTFRVQLPLAGPPVQPGSRPRAFTEPVREEPRDGAAADTTH